jgi:hypothetical protein
VGFAAAAGLRASTVLVLGTSAVFGVSVGFGVPVGFGSSTGLVVAVTPLAFSARAGLAAGAEVGVEAVTVAAIMSQ